jgi:beta-lactamase regulating signal transducer with metallopeptidase domain
MRPDLYTISSPESCLLLLAIRVLLARYFSPMQAYADDLIFLVFTASRLTYFGEGPFLLTVNTASRQSDRNM